MRRLYLAFITLMVLAGNARAQPPMPQPGDPPVLSLIRASEADESGTATISGGEGAVYAAANLLIRNLYTGQTVSTRASINGSFSARIRGDSSTPYWIGTLASEPTEAERNTTGSLPGGAGAILFDVEGQAEGTPFSVAGTLAEGTLWSARGQVDALALDPGDNLRLRMNVLLELPVLPADTQWIGVLGLQPIARAAQDGVIRPVGDALSNNGWSAIQTPSGLAVDNLRSSAALGEVVVGAQQMTRDDAGYRFTFDFNLALPDDLPPGLYVPLFEGYTQQLDGMRVRWGQNGTEAPNITDESVIAGLTRLPVVINVGGADSARLIWTLLIDNPSDGSRGVLADEDQAFAALSNRVRFNSPTYILPPGEYPLEPYLLNQMPNRYDTSGEPLIPFASPAGALEASVTRPDGTVDDLGSHAIVQNRLSTDAPDERALFGAQSQVDVYRLTTLDPLLARYPFDQYGDYTIALSGETQDAWGNRYAGGGTYRVSIAEPIDLTPAVLPGTPFEVGDSFHPGVYLAPGVPADVSAHLQVFPLDGGDIIERVFSGQANRYGYFDAGGDYFTFEAPGEYLVDYVVRYTDGGGRLWMASLRAAGVIASPERALIAHGERGLPSQAVDLRPAWFLLERYAAIAGVDPRETRLNAPYFSGDNAWIADGRNGGMRPVLRVQDRFGAYQNWVVEALEGYVSPQGLTINQLAVEDELPILFFAQRGDPYDSALLPERISSNSYVYISAVRPGVTMRQYVVGREDGGLPLYWDSDDPNNGQIGAGSAGDRPGDFAFIFGGAIFRNEAADLREATIYGAALSVIADANGARIFPPGRGRAGGPDGGALVALPNETHDMFFHPTGLQPGAVLVVGETASVAGQVAPTLPADVRVTITSPSGLVRESTGQANAVGAYFDPAASFVVEEVGMWTVQIAVRYDGVTSIGSLDMVPIRGGVVGSQAGSYAFYVVPPDAEQLPLNGGQSDTTIPVANQYNFNYTLPDDWTDIQVYRTLTMPGYILEDGALRVSGRSFNYTLNPAQISAAFPNFETDTRVQGVSASDARTLTLFATGVDAAGERQVRVRTYTIFHDRLLSLEP